jgi:hypothetical protein
MQARLDRNKVGPDCDQVSLIALVKSKTLWKNFYRREVAMSPGQDFSFLLFCSLCYQPSQPSQDGNGELQGCSLNNGG